MRHFQIVSCVAIPCARDRSGGETGHAIGGAETAHNPAPSATPTFFANAFFAFGQKPTPMS